MTETTTEVRQVNLETLTRRIAALLKLSDGDSVELQLLRDLSVRIQKLKET